VTVARTTLLVLATGSAVACATRDRESQAANSPLRVTSAWARPADSGTTGGAYITIKNIDTVPVIITSVLSSGAQSAELHESMMHDGMAHMTARPSVRIARDSTLSMVPGGLHVMLNGLTRSLAVGDTLAVTLVLNDGRQVPARVAVRAP
jgi:copper(I)-binding protein